MKMCRAFVWIALEFDGEVYVCLWDSGGLMGCLLGFVFRLSDICLRFSKVGLLVDVFWRVCVLWSFGMR